MAFNVRQIFAALNEARVDYVVVEGFAVITCTDTCGRRATSTS
ncbi:MAG: hypothetical protein U1F23_12880 [Lysobacterales bacterium]